MLLAGNHWCSFILGLPMCDLLPPVCDLLSGTSRRRAFDQYNLPRFVQLLSKLWTLVIGNIMTQCHAISKRNVPCMSCTLYCCLTAMSWLHRKTDSQGGCRCRTVGATNRIDFVGTQEEVGGVASRKALLDRSCAKGRRSVKPELYCFPVRKKRRKGPLNLKPYPQKV